MSEAEARAILCKIIYFFKLKSNFIKSVWTFNLIASVVTPGDPNERYDLKDKLGSG